MWGQTFYIARLLQSCTHIEGINLSVITETVFGLKAGLTFLYDFPRSPLQLMTSADLWSRTWQCSGMLYWKILLGIRIVQIWSTLKKKWRCIHTEYSELVHIQPFSSFEQFIQVFALMIWYMLDIRWRHHMYTLW